SMVATFRDDGGPEQLSDYSASIDWGDKTTATTGFITLSGSTFTVTGAHTYATGGIFTISVTISHETASPVTVSDTASITPIISGPTITSLTPDSVQEGSGSFTLTVSGSNFVSGATVQWTENGATTPLTPFSVSSSQLLVVVPSSLLSVGQAGTVSVTVV